MSVFDKDKVETFYRDEGELVRLQDIMFELVQKKYLTYAQGNSIYRGLNGDGAILPMINMKRLYPEQKES